MQYKYGKPQQFSDPYKDWNDCPERLQEILDKDDEDLDQSDFAAIFAEHLPAADYYEGLYYIPLCFQYMQKKLDPIDTNICSSVFWYMVHFKHKLEADGYYDDCLQRISGLIQSYTDSFELIRLDDTELEEHGIDKRYREMAKHCRSVHDLVDSLVKYDEYWAVISDWIERLAAAGDVGSCWWIDIASHVRWWHILYREDDQANARKEVIINRLHKFGDYIKHWHIVAPLAASDKFYEYNRRVAIT